MRPLSFLILLVATSFCACRAIVEGEEDAEIFPLGHIRMLPASANDMMGLGEGRFALVSDALYGSVRAVNVDDTSKIATIVASPGFGHRGSFGLAYSNGLIFVCGGGSMLGENNSTTMEAVLYVYNATTGQEIRKCYPEGGGFFMNDVAVKDGKAYATDSFSNSIMILDVAAAVDGVCDISAIELPSHLFLNSEEGFQASGIVGYADGLLLSHWTKGGLYYLDLNTKSTTEILPPGSAFHSDGLAIGIDDEAILYMTENANNRISAWSLEAWRTEKPEATVSITPRGTIFLAKGLYHHDPVSCAVRGSDLYCVSAIAIPGMDDEDNNMTDTTFSMIGRVERFAFESNFQQQLLSPNSQQLVDDMGSTWADDEYQESVSGRNHASENEGPQSGAAALPCRLFDLLYSSAVFGILLTLTI